MPAATPSALLSSLRDALARARRPDGTLPLDRSSLDGTAAASLLSLLRDGLRIGEFTLAANVRLPETVAGDTLIIGGDGSGVTLTVTFRDVGGEVAIDALFEAPARTALTGLF